MFLSQEKNILHIYKLLTYKNVKFIQYFSDLIFLIKAKELFDPENKRYNELNILIMTHHITLSYMSTAEILATTHVVSQKYKIT